MNSKSTTISVDNVSKSFGPFKAVQNLTFNITKGEIVGFLGTNGAGKTTTMRLLTSYYTPDDGKIFIEGVDNTQDDLKKNSTEVQNITDQYISKIDTLTSNKQKEILKV